MINRNMARSASALLAALVLTTGVAWASFDSTFPRIKLGSGKEPTSGGGVIAGSPYVTRSAVVAWNEHFGTLTLYLLRGRTVTCATFKRVITKPGHLIQVYVTNQPHVSVNQQVTDPQVAFLTIFKDPNIPTKVAGLKNGARLMFTRVNTYPRGVWHGVFKVPQGVYGDGKVYGYNGTFAAKWCDVRH
jgi:hypothetical protein